MRAGSIAALAPVVAMACTLALPQAAQGADYLRGSQIEQPVEPPTFSSGRADWSGIYFGGSVGFGTSQFDAAKQSSQLMDQAFHQLLVRPYGIDLIRLGQQGSDKTTFGGFVGYNFLFGDVVLGAELEYQRADFTTSETRSASRLYSNIIPTTVPTTPATEPVGTETVLSVAAHSKNKIEDFAVAKFRAGYVMGNFMPYVTLGAAVGRIRSDGRASQQNTTYESYDRYNVVSSVDPLTGAVTQSRGSYAGRSTFISDRGSSSAGAPKSGYVPGFALGGGVDALLTDNLFLRAEFQRIYFSEYKGVEAIVDTAKVGAALKF